MWGSLSLEKSILGKFNLYELLIILSILASPPIPKVAPIDATSSADSAQSNDVKGVTFYMNIPAWLPAMQYLQVTHP